MLKELIHFPFSSELNIPILKKLNPRSKYIKLRVNIKYSIIELTVPIKASKNNINKFLISNSHWIYQQYTQNTKTHSSASHIVIFFEEYSISFAEDNNQILIKDKILYFGASLSNYNRALKLFLKNILVNKAKDYAEKYCKLLNCNFSKISIKETFSRWGSCSSSGNITIAYNLIYAPIDILEYVVAHEVTHLLHMNHSKLFWETLSRIYPNYKEAKKWLKINGLTLMKTKINI